jgi:type VI secretion system protein ImpA
MTDLEKLLAPVSEESPTGVDLRDQPADLTFQELEEERTEVSPAEDPAGAGRSPHWPKLVAACEATLETTKDLQIAVWLTEAWGRQDGFEGLESGLRLLIGLIETHWEGLHPGADPEDGVVLPVRARPLNWLGSSKDFLDSISQCAVLGGGERPLSWYDYKNSDMVDAKKVLSDPTAYQDLKDIGFIDGDEWNARLGAQSGSDLRKVLGHVTACREALEDLRALCDKQFGNEDSPNLVGIGEFLYDLREYLEERVPDEVAEDEAEAGSETSGQGGGGGSGGQTQSREQALRKLAEAANYFRRAEPHSPISYLVERAVRWGGMPLMEVLQEFIEDPNALKRIQSNLGIQAQPAGSSSTSSTPTAEPSDDGF